MGVFDDMPCVNIESIQDFNEVLAKRVIAHFSSYGNAAAQCANGSCNIHRRASCFLDEMFAIREGHALVCANQVNQGLTDAKYLVQDLLVELIENEFETAMGLCTETDFRTKGKQCSFSNGCCKSSNSILEISLSPGPSTPQCFL
jgi:hypothetical protein